MFRCCDKRCLVYASAARLSIVWALYLQTFGLTGIARLYQFDSLH